MKTHKSFFQQCPEYGLTSSYKRRNFTLPINLVLSLWGWAIYRYVTSCFVWKISTKIQECGSGWNVKTTTSLEWFIKRCFTGCIWFSLTTSSVFSSLDFSVRELLNFLDVWNKYYITDVIFFKISQLQKQKQLGYLASPWESPKDSVAPEFLFFLLKQCFFFTAVSISTWEKPSCLAGFLSALNKNT